MRFVELRDRKYFIPDLFEETIGKFCSFRICTAQEAENTGRIMKDIRAERFLIFDKIKRSSVEILFEKISERIDEMIPYDDRARISSRMFSRNRKAEFENLRKKILDRILLIAEGDIAVSFTEKYMLRNLISFCGEDIYSYKGETFILPFRFLKELEKSLNDNVFVSDAETPLTSGINVLLPKSQETYSLFRSAMEFLTRKDSRKIIDMGCGSGILSILSDRIFSNSTIYLTDILPEAIASAMYNFENKFRTEFSRTDSLLKLSTGSNTIVCCESGDLFEKTEELFDIIIFNPPWINSEYRNRSEMALNDKDQKTVERFIIQSKHNLASGGFILLSYSDNSGEKSVENLNRMISSNGFEDIFVRSARVQSYQSGRKCMRIFVKILKRKL